MSVNCGLDYERGQLYLSERFGHGRCDVCLQCKARVMLAVIMNMYPSDKHGRVRCARWMLTASVIISCPIYSPAAFDLSFMKQIVENTRQ